MKSYTNTKLRKKLQNKGITLDKKRNSILINIVIIKLLMLIKIFFLLVLKISMILKIILKIQLILIDIEKISQFLITKVIMPYIEKY